MKILKIRQPGLKSADIYFTTPSCEIFGLITYIATLLRDSDRKKESAEFLKALLNEAVNFDKIVEIMNLYMAVDE